MNENEVEKCYCDVGYEKGAIIKTSEFEKFSIYGNIMKKNTIVIRYVSNSPVLLTYTFNNKMETKKEILLTKCSHQKNSYCISIDLEDNICLNLSFNTEPTCNYDLKIANNTLDDILNKYEPEKNDKLPTIKSANTANKFTSFIYKFITMLLKRNKVLK